MFISPAVAGDLVFIGSCSGNFFAFDLDGEVRWAHSVAEDGVAALFHGDAIVSDDLVVVGSDAEPFAYLYAFERRTGEVRWSLPLNGGVSRDLRRFGDSVLAVSVSGEVLAADLASGEILWQVDDPPAGARGARSGDPALEDGRFYVPWRPGVVDAFDAATGVRLWRRELEATFNTSLAVVGDQLVIGAVDGHLYRLRTADGEVLGSHEIDGMPYGDLVTAGERSTGRCLLVLWREGEPASGSQTRPHVVACLVPASGDIRWSHQVADGWGTLQPLVRGDEVVLGHEGRLLALALSDGALLWQRPVRGLPRGLGASAETLYVGTLSGAVLAMPWRSSGPLE